MGIYNYNKEMRKLVIFGTGPIAELAYYYFTNDSDFEVVAFTVDASFKNSDSFNGLPVISFDEVQYQYSPNKFLFFVALSYSEGNKLREDKYLAAKNLGYSLVSYVSSHATILNEYQIGDNCFILEDNTIQPFVTIGNNVTLWSGNHLGHHSLIGDHVFITSHVVISGGAVVGNNTFVGVNSTIRDHIKIGANNIIGAGSLIMKSTLDGEIYVPARTSPRIR